MEIELDRRPSSDDCTIGDLFVSGTFECFTLEDVVREDPDPSTPQNEAKVPGWTAIPPGRYRVTLETSRRFGPDTLTINEVPGYSSIRIHSGNTAEDTAGCPLVGDKVAGGRIVYGTTKPALAALKAKVIDAIRTRGEECWITIKNP